MGHSSGRSKKKIYIVTASVLLVFAILLVTCAIYLGDYYRADHQAIGAFLPQGAQWKEEPDGNLVFKPAGATKGFIFYPGGKVEHTAYIPLMQACAEQGVLCVLVDMPFNLPVLDVNAADGIREEYPEIEAWYIGGHSLGGSMAAAYLADRTEDYEGLILLGSYSTADLSDTDLDVLSVYGSEDGVMNREKYEECLENLPTDFTEYIIDGGNHAYFGAYGEQDGDGEASISHERQIGMSGSRIGMFLKGWRWQSSNGQGRWWHVGAVSP